MMITTLVTGPRTALAAGFLFVSAAAFAQQPAVSAETTSSCTHTFSKGGFSYCVNAHGNMPSFIGPAGFEHVRLGIVVEGYELCSATFSHGYDVGSSESAWGATALISGPTSTGVGYSRTTADGRFRIEHTFKMDTAEHDVTLTVKVINISSVTMTQVAYTRFIDIDAANNNTNDMWTNSRDEIEAVDIVQRRGMSINAITFDTAHFTGVVPFAALTPNCGVAHFGSNGDIGDNMALIQYTLGTMGPGQSKTVKYVYKRK
jgi:hypothetical protein